MTIDLKTRLARIATKSSAVKNGASRLTTTESLIAGRQGTIAAVVDEIETYIRATGWKPVYRYPLGLELGPEVHTGVRNRYIAAGWLAEIQFENADSHLQLTRPAGC